jgi:hypothetical protein
MRSHVAILAITLSVTGTSAAAAATATMKRTESAFEDRLREARASWLDHHKRLRQPISKFVSDIHDRLSERPPRVARKADENNSGGLLSASERQYPEVLVFGQKNA